MLHLNSVSDSATLVVRADNTVLYRTNLPNLDGGWNVNNEYNMDISVNLPSGKRLIEVTNAGGDWFYLDWVRLENVLPATYPGNWQPSPDAIGLRGQRESLLYVVAPGVSFPSSATNAALPVQHGQVVTLTNWPGGRFFAEWYRPRDRLSVGDQPKRGDERNSHAGPARFPGGRGGVGVSSAGVISAVCHVQRRVRNAAPGRDRRTIPDREVR